MLTSRFDLDQLPWEESNKIGNEFFENSNLFPEEPYRSIRSESLSVMASVAHLWEWDFDDQVRPTIKTSKEIWSSGLSIWNVMKCVQESCHVIRLDWFHPDPQTIYSRSETGPTYISILATFQSQEEIQLSIILNHGEVDIYEDFCRDLESRVVI